MKRLDEIHGTILLSNEDIESHLLATGWNRVVDAIAETFIEEARGRVKSPPKTIMSFEECNNDFRMMPSYMEKYPDFCGTKVIGACNSNPEKYGLPLAMGIYLLNEKWTQKNLMIFDACIPTAWRTAAASAVGVRELSHMDSNILGLVGCGQQAYYHIRAITAIRNIKNVLVYDINEENMYKLINRFKPFNIIKSSKEEILNRADIMVTMTPTTKAHIFTNELPDRKMMICAIGGDSEIKMEFEPSVLAAVDHFCDSLDQVAHTGTVHKALKQNLITIDNLKSLGNLMIGKEKLDDSKKIKMFFSTGVALEDLAMAILLYNRVKNLI
jgi:ornithine cyclodeaminase/alanine dehydrogenase-like protein (mu-crystallin family)